MKQRFTRGVHIKRGGAPRYSYPYAKRDATCTMHCSVQHQISLTAVLKLSSPSQFAEALQLQQICTWDMKISSITSDQPYRSCACQLKSSVLLTPSLQH